MKYLDLKNKDSHELQELLRTAKIKLGKLNFESANKALKDFSQISKTRVEIAQLLTALKQKNLKK